MVELFWFNTVALIIMRGVKRSQSICQELTLCMEDGFDEGWIEMANVEKITGSRLLAPHFAYPADVSRERNFGIRSVCGAGPRRFCVIFATKNMPDIMTKYFYIRAFMLTFNSRRGVLYPPIVAYVHQYSAYAPRYLVRWLFTDTALWVRPLFKIRPSLQAAALFIPISIQAKSNRPPIPTYWKWSEGDNVPSGYDLAVFGKRLTVD